MQFFLYSSALMRANSKKHILRTSWPTSPPPWALMFFLESLPAFLLFVLPELKKWENHAKVRPCQLLSVTLNLKRGEGHTFCWVQNHSFPFLLCGPRRLKSPHYYLFGLEEWLFHWSLGLDQQPSALLQHSGEYYIGKVSKDYKECKLQMIL